MTLLCQLDIVVRLPDELHFVKLFGFLIGWGWIVTGLYLQYNGRYEFVRTIPLIFYAVGTGVLLIPNRFLVDVYSLSLFLTIVGYGLVAVGGAVFATWLIVHHPPLWTPKDADDELTSR